MTASYQLPGPYFFGRSYQIAITPPGSTSAFAYGTTGPAPSPLRVSFTVDRTLKSSTNKATFSLFNMSQQNRQAIGKNSLVRLVAGYPGLTGTIFLGYCAKVKTERAGPDLVTSIEAGDGEAYITYATFDRSYAQPVSLAQVLQDVAGAMQVDFGGQTQAPTAGIVKGIPNKTYARGIHLHGSCRSILDKLLHPLKIDWSVQNGQLCILPRTAANTVIAQVLSAASGLVGVPSTNADFVSFQSLLNPRLAPGSLVQLSTKNQTLAGAYKLRRVQFKGDSHGGDWVADCEGVKLTNPYAVVPAAQGTNYATAVTA